MKNSRMKKKKNDNAYIRNTLSQQYLFALHTPSISCTNNDTNTKNKNDLQSTPKTHRMNQKKKKPGIKHPSTLYLPSYFPLTSFLVSGTSTQLSPLSVDASASANGSLSAEDAAAVPLPLSITCLETEMPLAVAAAAVSSPVLAYSQRAST